MGIIDYLQEWDLSKKIENKWKGLVYARGHSEEISSVHPKFYAKRFLDFMNNEVLKTSRYNSVNSDQLKIKL